ncbi:MAG: preprotein translocase subunit SecE [Candidatus Komeilibacteria bacterium CG_4_10_14_0_2_um_filter_37_10]|uniref:Protein translocase subunit SecE n=1 Tax=Candidatus Komeilibacteria bacterium CG_4_10_14_0_2_um_filter_37_10 TaxID=1974470 RepID=A0A2M7VEZ2_9BACT|nr:MAG: preprotein translocase subunit SecE [Candidatus Komeilibacteria bacterium CG_4_10_14_0_2_um_filter_37_10]
MNQLIQYLKDSRAELRKVAWPTKQETIKHTLLVIGVSLGMAVILGAADFLFTYLFEYFISK